MTALTFTASWLLACLAFFGTIVAVIAWLIALLGCPRHEALDVPMSRL